MHRSLQLVVLAVVIGQVVAASESISGFVIAVDADHSTVEVRQLKTERILRLKPRADAKIRLGKDDLQLASIPVGSRAVILVDDDGSHFRQLLISDPSLKSEPEPTIPQQKPDPPVAKTTPRTAVRTEAPKLPRVDPPQINVGSRLAPGNYTTHIGPRGGVFHYSAAGKKVYEKK